MKAHLLFRERDFEESSSFRVDGGLVQDLELQTLLEAMADGDKFLFDTAGKVLLSGLDDPEAIEYRQAILRDCIDHPDTVRALYDVTQAAFEGKRYFFGFPSHHPTGILSHAVQSLELYFEQLKHLRRIADEHADEFQSEGFTALMEMLVRELDDDYFRVIDSHLRRLRFRGGLLLSAELGVANKGTAYVLRSPSSSNRGWKARIGIGTGPSYSFELHPRDEAGARALSKVRDRGINLVANALAQSMEHVQSFFAMLRFELAFYVSCVNVHDRLTTKGEPTCLPTALPCSPPGLFARGLLDVCLTLTVSDRVVGNDLDAEGKSLVMITGANSGGKSTFLRSVGLAQLMMQCGMFVAATTFRGSVSAGLFTHFIRKEDSTMVSGKLDEELRRMSSIADSIAPHCMVLFNESFSATNEREGSEIARQTICALVDSDIRVFFVTHLFDLAESLRLRGLESTQFLRAERDPDGNRSFKVVPGDPLPTGYGDDLYRRLFRSDGRTMTPIGSVRDPPLRR
ncbi:MAG: MutS-related protein [Acidimicrobiales bacterium]